MVMTIVMFGLFVVVVLLGLAHIAALRRRGRAEREAIDSERRYRLPRLGLYQFFELIAFRAWLSSVRPSLQLATTMFDTTAETELTSLKPLAAWFEQESTKSLKKAPFWAGAPADWTAKVHAPAPTSDTITEFCPEPRMSTYWA